MIHSNGPSSTYQTFQPSSGPPVGGRGCRVCQLDQSLRRAGLHGCGWVGRRAGCWDWTSEGIGLPEWSDLQINVQLVQARVLV